MFTKIKLIAKCLIFIALSLIFIACVGKGNQFGGNPQAAQTSSPEGRAYTADSASNTISVIDIALQKRIDVIKTGAQPHHLAIRPKSNELWVTLYGADYVQIFDITDHSYIGKVDVGASSDDISFSEDEQIAYISLGTSNRVAIVDCSSRKLTKTILVGKAPHGIKVNPEGKEVYVTSTEENRVIVLSSISKKVAKHIRVGTNPYEVLFTRDDTAIVTNLLDNTLSIIRQGKVEALVRVGQQPSMMALSQDGKLLLVANAGSSDVSFIDTGSWKEIRRIPTGLRSHGVAIIHNKALVTNMGDGSVSIIDLLSYRVIGRVQVGEQPNGIAVKQ